MTENERRGHWFLASLLQEQIRLGGSIGPHGSLFAPKAPAPDERG